MLERSRSRFGALALLLAGLLILSSCANTNHPSASDVRGTSSQVAIDHRRGYWLVGANGSVLGYGNATFHGS
ncbi:MAG: hypothetical protein ACRD1G_15890, partial [Acidimicrobiales bacterium]